MKKIVALTTIFSILLVILFSGCVNNNSEVDKFIGIWETNHGLTLIFYQNNTCAMQGLVSGKGKWNISDNRLFVTIEFSGGKNYMAYDYKFSNEDTVLTLTDAGGNSWSYSKK
jgi:hypothetical protein